MRNLFQALTAPVSTETQQGLQEKWQALPASLKTERQIYGRHEEGCGATVGAMPRCDFACKGCYLTAQANRVPALSLDDVKAQLRQLRAYLGRWGNLQLTDGELTLRPEAELIELIQYAREIKLIPMLMTHGDSFRRRPGLLERLMLEGGLDEISLHIDTTQRGRKGYKNIDTERALNPLRKEFADIVRRARSATQRPLRVAATITVTPDSLDQIPDILQGMTAHPDVYRLISFLPVAQVGRTEDGFGGGVSSDEVWQQISATIGFAADDWRWHFGHASCNRFLMGLQLVEPRSKTRYFPISMVANEADERFMRPFFEQFGGLTFRADRPAAFAARAVGMFFRAPVLLSFGAMRYGWSWLKRIEPRHPLRVAFKLATGRMKLHRLTLGTHHFMSREEAESPEGQERIDQCIFKVPDGDQMVSMCTFNTQGGRERLYQQLSDSLPIQSEPKPAHETQPV